jgi:hypothetical protein
MAIMFSLPLNSVENEVHTPDISQVKTIKDELPMPKATATIEGEVDVRRKVSSYAI